MSSRRFSAAMVLAALTLAATGISVIVGSTSAVAAVSGITNGQYGVSQVFDVTRSPAYPTCTTPSTFNSWTVSTGSTTAPYSEATNARVNLGSGYLKVFSSGNSSAPWGVAYYNSAGQELRYNGTAWVTQPGGGWTSQARFAATGQIYGVAAQGFLFDSGTSHFGTYFSNNAVLGPNQSFSYTPSSSYQTCTAGQAVGDPTALASYPVQGSPLVVTSLTSLVPSVGAFSSPFSPATASYSIALPAGTSSISFVPTAAQSGAQITRTVSGSTAPVTSGSSTGAIALTTGANVVTFLVTATDTTTQTYTVTITVAPSIPSPPTSVVAAAGTSSVTVSWTAPSPSPSTGVTGYTVTANPGPASCSTSSAATTSCVIGATAGTAYTYTVVAHSAAGDSAASAASTAVTPTAPVVATVAPTSAPTTLTTLTGAISTATPGQSITVVGAGFAAYSTATVILYSAPQVLTNVTTDALGGFSVAVTVPQSIAAGEHNLVASGVDAAGVARVTRLPFTVAAVPVTAGLATTGTDALPVGLVAAFLLLAGFGASIVARRLRIRGSR